MAKDKVVHVQFTPPDPPDWSAVLLAVVRLGQALHLYKLRCAQVAEQSADPPHTPTLFQWVEREVGSLQHLAPDLWEDLILPHLIALGLAPLDESL